MKCWIPLFIIFLHLPCPKSEASRWLQKSFNPSSNATRPLPFPLHLSFHCSQKLQTHFHGLSFSSSGERITLVKTPPDFAQARIYLDEVIEEVDVYASEFVDLMDIEVKGRQIFLKATILNLRVCFKLKLWNWPRKFMYFVLEARETL